MSAPSASESSAALPPGTLVDRYLIEALLGRGGFAFTYRARHRQSGETVAIKELFPQDCRRVGDEVQPASPDGEDLLARSPKWFREEALILRGFDNRRIVDVLNTFNANNTTYVVMRYLDGVNLEHHAQAAGGCLPAAEVGGILREILLGLQEVHDGGIVHLDLKPSNIMRTSSGGIVLIDFGAAKEHRAAGATASTVLFTRDYAPPEQFDPRAEKTNPTDLFAVGGIGFRLLMGAPIGHFDDQGGLGEQLAARSQGQPALARVIGWALQRDPAARPRSALQMRAALEGAGKPGRGIFDPGRRRFPRPGPPRPQPQPEEREVHRARRRREPQELSREAKGLAAGAAWPLAFLAAIPALVLPLLTAVTYLAILLILALARAVHGAFGEALSERGVTAATLLFIGPRLLGVSAAPCRCSPSVEAAIAKPTHRSSRLAGSAWSRWVSGSHSHHTTSNRLGERSSSVPPANTGTVACSRPGEAVHLLLLAAAELEHRALSCQSTPSHG